MNTFTFALIFTGIGLITGYLIGKPSKLFWNDVEEELKGIKGVGNTTATRIKNYLKKTI